jgi:hypothetical protein
VPYVMNLIVGQIYYVPTLGPEKVKARFVGMNQGIYEFVEVDSGKPLSLDPDYIYQLEEIDDA